MVLKLYLNAQQKQRVQVESENKREWARNRLEGRSNFLGSYRGPCAEILKEKIDIEVDIPIIGKKKVGEYKINSFAQHILLMALAPSEVWSKKEFEAAALAVNHHLAVLWYCLAHNEKPSSFDHQTINDILDKCPDSGARSSLSVGTGWQKDNRWIRCSDINKPGSGDTEYNGVDFLMVHNLAQLVLG